MSALRRSLIALTVCAPLAFGSLALPTAVAESDVHTAATAAGRLRVVISTPPGVPAQVRLRGPKPAVASKPAAGTSAVIRPAVLGGVYRVAADDVAYKGATYRAVRPPTRITVPTTGAEKVLRITFVKLATVRIGVVSAAPRAITLQWQAPAGARVVLRRAIGDIAPATRTAGLSIRVGAGRATDRSVSPAKKYSYAVFVKRSTGWIRGALTVGTPAATGPAVPFSLTPGSIVVDKSDSDVVTVVGGTIRVRLATGRPTPALGAGFVLPPSASLPGGLVGTVKLISPDGRVVTIAPGGLADAFATLDVKAALDSAPITMEPETDSAAARQRIARFNEQRAAADNTRTASLMSCFDEVEIASQLSGIRPILRPSGHWNSGVKSRWGIPYAATFDLRAALDVGITFDLQTNAAVKCGLPLRKVAKQFQAGPVPIGLVFEPVVEISLSGEAQMQDIDAVLTNGFYAKGQIGLNPSFQSGPIQEFNVSRPTVTGAGFAATVKIGGELTVGPGVVTSDVGVVAGVQGFLNPFIAGVKVIGVASSSQPAGCVSFQAGGEMGLGLQAKAWAGRFTWSASWNPDALKKTWNYGSPIYFPENCEKEPDTGSGDVQATLTWNSTADLDLHVIDPNSEEVYYGNPTAASGGALDVDANAGCGDIAPYPTENIFWPQDGAPPGSYQVQVVTYATCDDPDLSWHLVVRVSGVVVLDTSGSDTSSVHTVNVGG